MEIKKVGTSLNLTIQLLILCLFIVAGCFFAINFNLDKMTPDKFIAVKIEGEAQLKPVIVQPVPILNTQSMKEWIKTSVNYFMNYNSTNYYDIINGGSKYMTQRIYPAYRKDFLQKVEENIKNGYQISSSIVISEPALIGQTRVNGIPYYRFYVRTSTEYKAETKTMQREHDVIVVVKKEDPKDFFRGVAIDELKIK